MYYLTKKVNGQNTFLSFTNDAYGSHWAWDMENITLYPTAAAAQRSADNHVGNIEVKQA